jgi:hypothetical protein
MKATYDPRKSITAAFSKSLVARVGEFAEFVPPMMAHTTPAIESKVIAEKMYLCMV